MPSNSPRLATHPVLHSTGWLLGFALTVYVTAQPLLTPTIPGSGVRLMWIPGALLALAFIMRRNREGPFYAVIYSAIALNAEQSRQDLALDVALILIEVAQALAFAYVSRRYFRLRQLIGNPVGMMLYLVAALVVTAAGATLVLAAAGSVPLSPEGFREELAARPALAWRTWWLCNATGYVTFTCSLRFLFAMRRQQWSDIFDDQRERRGYAALAVLVLLAAAIGFPVWDVSGLNLPPDVRLAMTLVPAPLGFALAARFRGLGASAAVLLITPFAIISATGPNAQINWSDLPPITTMMHIYLLVLTATCWVLAAISRQLKWAVAEAVEAEKRKARYVATINHELRTPLNAILGFSELMRLQDLREEGQPFEDIHESGRRLLAMIEQLLSQSDRGASVFRLNKEPVRLARLLTRTIDEMRAERQREDCKVTLDASDQLIMHADSRALRQMMLVLLSQALRRVGPQSEIAVCASDNGSELIIDVETQRPADYAQDSREKLELQLLNALALAQGGRLETLRSGPRSRVVRLIFSSSVAVWKGKRVAGRQ